MSINADKLAVENALTAYRERLDTIPDDIFNVTPPGGGWSYGEVYSHIMQSNFGSLIALEKCSNGTGKTNTKALNWLGRLVFLIGRFPPVKIKAPEKIAALVVNESKEDARNQIIKIKKKIDELLPVLMASSKNCRIRHPRMGMLNARQWLTFIAIHSRHHLRQLQRIDKKFHSA